MMNIKQLLDKGYNLRQAARAIGRSAPHVKYVLEGKRESEPLILALEALPKRELKPRRRIMEKETAPKNLT